MKKIILGAAGLLLLWGAAEAMRLNPISTMAQYCKSSGDCKVGVETTDGSSNVFFAWETPTRAWMIRLGANDKLVVRDATANEVRLSFKTDGTINVNDLSGSYGGGQATVCVNDNGDLVAVDGACS